MQTLDEERRDEVKNDEDNWEHYGREEDNDDPTPHHVPSVAAWIESGTNHSTLRTDRGDVNGGPVPSNTRYAVEECQNGTADMIPGASTFGSSTDIPRSVTQNDVQSAAHRSNIAETSGGSVNSGAGGAWQSQGSGTKGKQKKGKGQGKAKFENGGTDVPCGRSVPGSSGWTGSKGR